jgi:hypothetical protein
MEFGGARVNTRLIHGLVVLLLLVSSAYSQIRARESLRGLNGVYVYVQPVGKDVEAGGLSRVQIQKAVEKQLQEAGIPLHSEPNPADGSANVAIVIDTVKQTEGAFLYGVEVSLLQEVNLLRRKDPDPFIAQTWSAKAIGITGANRMGLILEPLRATLGNFISDYITVNPKTTPPK